MLPIILIAPVIQLFILSYAATFDIFEIKTAIVDNDKSASSREFVSRISANSIFKVADSKNSDKALEMIDNSSADMAIVIPSGFEKNIEIAKTASLQVFLNGSDANYAMSGLNYLAKITANYSEKIMVERLYKTGLTTLPKVGLESRIWFNPELKSRHFMVPAIIALILMIITIMLTAMAIVKEKESGTIESLVVTPISKIAVLGGKLVPFIIIGLIDVCLVTSVAVFWFGIPLKGSFFLLIFASLLFLFNTLGLGLFVSTISRTQQQAMMTVMFFIMMPFIYLSGFIFPIDNMPRFFQYISAVIPLTHFLEILRSLFLSGSGLELLKEHFIALFLSGSFVFAVSITRFRKYI